MSKYETEIRSALDEQERQVCLDLLRASPELTLGDIHKLSRGSIGRHFGSITVGELLGSSGSSGAQASGAKLRVAPAPASASVNTRTAAGRKAYDDALLDALKAEDKPVSASRLIARVGGSKLQARAALNRLIETKKITWTGKARGTKYAVA
ncbi:MAG: hypothetical protein KC468_10700 [Myxococcales bacterium]|nr:hypothetical protein [Myxococcales bacterium]